MARVDDLMGGNVPQSVMIKRPYYEVLGVKYRFKERTLQPLPCPFYGDLLDRPARPLEITCG